VTKMQDKMLYLVRGLPGAGKSTFAETLAETLGCLDFYEADDYFYCHEDGIEGYHFNISKLPNAHEYCRTITRRAMQSNDRNIVVSNTFTREKELKPYLDLATEYGYSVTSIIVENRHGNQSIHGVPIETLEKMRNRFSIKL